MDLRNMTIKKAHDHLVKGDFSPWELAQACIKNIEEKNKEVNAFLEIYDDVREQAAAAEKLLKSGKGTLLTGIPMAMKDNILIKGKKASASSKILEGYTATYDSTVTKLLKEQGVVFIGRTNMDEFAMGSSTEYSAFGTTKNPLDTTRVAGGSSGGSAAAVAMNGALFSLGSDTGGSIRQPASFVGVVGLKPTYGSVSRYGLMALSSSLDQIGPMGKTVGDVEAVFNVISKYDANDSTNVPEKTREESKTNIRASKKIIGVPADILAGKDMAKDVFENFKTSLKKLEDLGYTIKEINLPHIAASLPVYYIIQPAEASSNLARFDGVRFGLRVEGHSVVDTYKKTRGKGFGKEVRRRIMLGTYVLSAGYHDAYYNKAENVRQLITQEFMKAFESVDLIATPTTAGVSFQAGAKKDPVAMYLEDIFTVPANLSGMPAISIPSGTGESDMPLGLQLTAPHFCEDRLFETGKEFFGEV